MVNLLFGSSCYWRQCCVAVATACTFIFLGSGCDGSDKFFHVQKYTVNTDMEIQAGSQVHVVSEGKIKFGGGIIDPHGPGEPELTADGDGAITPTDYPYPQLRKNSLVCLIDTVPYQCGVDRTFYPSRDGTLHLEPNDNQTQDNEGEWKVKVYVRLPSKAQSPGGSPVHQPLPLPNIPWTYGPVGVSKIVETGLPIEAGSTVHVTSPLGDQVDFGGAVGGGGAPKLNADGDDWWAPTDYPAPELRKNSLISGAGCGTRAEPTSPSCPPRTVSWYSARTIKILPTTPGAGTSA